MLAVAQFDLVERLHWLTREEYVELLLVGQVLPGPNIVTIPPMVGDRCFRLRGALAALAGMVAIVSCRCWPAGCCPWRRWRCRPRAGRPAPRGMRAFAAGMAPLTVCLLLATGRAPVAPARGHPGLLAAAALTVVATLSRWRPQPIWLAPAGLVVGSRAGSSAGRVDARIGGPYAL